MCIFWGKDFYDPSKKKTLKPVQIFMILVKKKKRDLTITVKHVAIHVKHVLHMLVMGIENRCSPTHHVEIH